MIIVILTLFVVFILNAKKKGNLLIMLSEFTWRLRISIQEGLWKLTGLPGLILEASESTGQHSFIANGLQTTKQEIIPIYPYIQYDNTTRIEMLRKQRYTSDHNNSIINATIDLNLGSDHIKNEEEAKIDFLETDYH